MNPELTTDRLVLRRWKYADLAPFAALNADPVVMEYFQALMTGAESDAFVARIEAHFESNEFGLFAVEVQATGTFIGFVGLWPADFDAPFTPAVEVGWRLARSAWGNGYATEAARAAVADGFERLGMDEIVSFTAGVNDRSWRVMERLGMQREPTGDFNHPKVPSGHRLEHHVFYRLLRPRTSGRRDNGDQLSTV